MLTRNIVFLGGGWNPPPPHGIKGPKYPMVNRVNMVSYTSDIQKEETTTQHYNGHYNDWISRRDVKTNA